jgi:hypothetical protein
MVSICGEDLGIPGGTKARQNELLRDWATNAASQPGQRIELHEIGIVQAEPEPPMLNMPRGITECWSQHSG